MIGRRAAVGLSLLCALVFCAFAAQSASAKGTTAFTCEPHTGVAGDKGFSDEHCDKAAENTAVKFIHAPAGGIKENEKTAIEVTNEKTLAETAAATPAVLRTTLGGVIFEIECKTVKGSGKLTNITDGEKVMQSQGTELKTEFTNCTVIRPENGGEKRHPCTVKEPISLENNPESLTKEKLGTSKKEMGVEFLNEVGKAFATFTIEGGANCSLNGTKVEPKGTAIATGPNGSAEGIEAPGGTLKFTTAMTSETLKVGTAVAEFSANLTVKKEKGNPITLTTTAT